MFVRLLILMGAIIEYFKKKPSERSIKPEEWLVVRQAASILDPATEAMIRVQGGEGVFISEAINIMKGVHSSFIFDTQEIRRPRSTTARA